MTPPSSIQVWQASTAVAATSVASLNLSLSLLLTPSLLPLPTYWVLRQWKASYRRTEKVLPLTMVACGISYAALSFRLSSAATTTKSRLLGAAAALCVSVIPWTKFLMMDRFSAKILEMADRGDDPPSEIVWSAQDEKTAKWLVDQWGLYNLGRGLPVLIAGAIGGFTLS